MYDKSSIPPTVAIIGKPNVGKSSLFNRLIEKRKAITSDEPGVTRDINYEIIRYRNLEYRLADSTGYIKKVEGIENQAQELNLRLIEEAALIIFICDIKSLSVEDFNIAKAIRKSGKPCFLVVNKVDNDKLLYNFYDFFELGLEDPISISAIHGKNIAALREKIRAKLCVGSQEEKLSVREIGNDKPRPHIIIDVAIVGRPNVGKSSLLNLLVEKERALVNPIPGTTRDTVDETIRFEGYDVKLMDTAGIKKRKKVKKSIEFYSLVRAENAIKNSTISVLLISADDGITTQDKKIASIIIKEKKGLIVAANKWDIVKKKGINFHDFVKDIYFEFPHIRFADVVPISAKTGYNKIKLLKNILTVYNNYNRKIKTSELNSLLKRLSHQGSSIKYGYQKKISPPLFEFFTGRASNYDDNFKKFITNSIRKSFTFSGVPVEVIFRK